MGTSFIRENVSAPNNTSVCGNKVYRTGLEIIAKSTMFLQG